MDTKSRARPIGSFVGNQVKDRLEQIASGLLSNYPVCCIVWFLLRQEVLSERLWKDKAFYHWWTTNIWPIENRGVCLHIRCPYHLVKQKNPIYYECKKCGWEQLEEKKCKRCNMKGEPK
jgi:hypothetical protein